MEIFHLNSREKNATQQIDFVDNILCFRLMNSQFESLADVTLLELFQYFYSDELVDIFWPLNQRFQCLIQSMPNLIYLSNRKNDNFSFFSLIQTVVLRNPLDELLNCFSNLRRLYLNYATENLVDNLRNNRFPHLTHLSIDRRVNPFYMPALVELVFNDGLPRLQSCYLSRIRSPTIDQTWTKSSHLRILRVNELDATMFRSILLVCPNLMDLKWKLLTESTEELQPIEHRHMKRMTVKIIAEEWPWNDRRLKTYLSCVPNLEQFIIHRSISSQTSSVDSLHSYDWLSTILMQTCPFVQRFLFRISHFHFDSFEIEKFSRLFTRKFHRFYQNSSQYRLSFC